ncbi:MAG: hypothetical protein HY513_04965 [Candidatus Aenigmarchaeota archaeon]|nr:hypothetical protein [Candidatus Aenigmarchaeota archaeon]
MKGATNIEFLIAVFVFLTTIAFIAFSIISNVPLLHGRASADNIRSLTYQFSEQLIFDKGLKQSDGTSDWTANDVARAGLSTGVRYEIQRSKLDELSKMCASPSGYSRLSQFLGAGADVSIGVSFNGTSIIICKPSVYSTVRNEFSILRPIVEDNRGEGVLSIKVIK